MYQFILIVHVVIAFLIVGLVLIQQGKGATMGAAFGSGASQTVFGSRGSGSFLFRVTLGIAAIFFFTSISLNAWVSHSYKQEKVMLPLKTSTQPNTIPNNAHAPIAPVEKVPTK